MSYGIQLFQVHFTFYSLFSLKCKYQMKTVLLSMFRIQLWLFTLCCLSARVVNTLFFLFFFSTKLSVVNCSPYFNLIKLILCLLTFRCIFYFFFFSLYLAKEQYFIPGRFGSAVRLTNCRYSLPFTPKAKFVIAFRKLMHVY